VSVAPQSTTAERVQQVVVHVDQSKKQDLLHAMLADKGMKRALVFARTKHGADKIVKNLVRDGIRAAAIHGNKSQSVRQRTLDSFKSNRPPVLVATDIAARGLDVDGISHVINYELPDVAEVYVHRIGRTGRAGATGIATTFCGRDERDQLRQIERLTRQTIAVEQDHPEYPQVAPATHDSSRRPNSRGQRPRRPNGNGRPTNGGPSKSHGRALQGQGATASNGGQAGNRRRRRPAGGRRNSL
jgi:ATP-dependent RNA helicase RhlE